MPARAPKATPAKKAVKKTKRAPAGAPEVDKIAEKLLATLRTSSKRAGFDVASLRAIAAASPELAGLALAMASPAAAREILRVSKGPSARK